MGIRWLGNYLKGIRELDTEMTKSCKYLGLAVILAVGGALTSTSVLAQSITIDGTLSPAQTLTGPVYTIPQSVGQTVGSNLFHSFGIFNLNMGERANFGSATDIRNIFSRVTGGSRSLIDGLIFTNSAAESASGNGGDINLQSNLLLLRRGGQISTTAGTALAGGNGGNINIDAGFIVAVPQENSDITANAFSGNGGTVTINAQGIFGIQSRQQPTLQSDITASSTGGGINGVVDINTLDIDPNRAFINLP
jgi:filamentous hemagglutinin family protein